MNVSLARALSKLGLASRAEARTLIGAGRVSVNGRVVTDPDRRVIPERLTIEIDGQRQEPAQARRIIVFHKPRGVITSRRDPEGRPTVFDLLGEAGRGLVAAGRLDRASTGLLILTNDTQFADRLTDPNHRVRRVYVVTVRGRVEPDTANQIERGLEVASTGGRRERLAASHVTIRKASGRETHLLVELIEGKNREIRRLFDAVGHEVTRVHRIAFGDFQLGNLQPGQWREEGGVEKHGKSEVKSTGGPE